MSTLVGVAAVNELPQRHRRLNAAVFDRHERQSRDALAVDGVRGKDTSTINAAIKERNFTEAMDLRGRGYKESFHILRTLVRAFLHNPKPGQRRLTLAVMTASAPSPGMNAAVRARGALGAGYTGIIYWASPTVSSA